MGAAGAPAGRPALLCGSTARDRATPASDLDVVLLFADLPRGASRETLRVDGVLVEAFLHDPGTLRYFIHELDREAGVATLAELVAEGIPVAGLPEGLHAGAKEVAASALALGPPPLDPDDADRRRYVISSLADDLDSPLSLPDRVAAAAELFTRLADYALRMEGRFSGTGKALARALARYDPVLAEAAAAGVAALLATGSGTGLQAVVDRALAPHGGRLVENYRAQAPAGWRL